MNNIFSALYKYKPQPNMTPEENFFTESFKFILELDKRLLRRFVALIGNGNSFSVPYTVESQVRFGNSIVDLVISNKNNKKIIIEIKLGAQENIYTGEEDDSSYGQVEKYLRLNKGYVCFIARDESDIEIKTNTNNFLGQFEWFQIYELIDEFNKNNKLSELQEYFINNFLNFMKDRDMQPFQGFSKKDLATAETDFFEFYDKLLDYLNYVKKDKRIIDFCKRNNLIITKPLFYTSWKGFVLKMNHVKYKSLVISIGFSYYKYSPSEPEYPEGLYHHVDLCTHKPGLGSKIKEKNKKLNISKKYFLDQYPWNNCILYNEKIFSDFIKNGVQKSVDFIIRQLEELENKEVINEIEKFYK